MANSTLHGIHRRFAVPLIACALFLAAGCNRDSAPSADRDALPDIGKEGELALSRTVDFRLTDAILTRWERAQANLENLSTRELRGSDDGGATEPIARAVNRLTSNKRARAAIESAGISVRDYVLATVALAQALKATDPANRRAAPGVPQENISFVLSRRSRLAARSRPPSWSNEFESADSGSMGISESDGAAGEDAEEGGRAVGADPVVPAAPPDPVTGGQPIPPDPAPPADTLSDSLAAPPDSRRN